MTGIRKAMLGVAASILFSSVSSVNVSTEEKSIYDKVGGTEGIATVV